MMHIMRYPATHKQEVRERIVRAAAQALRVRGVSGVSIPELMKQAGLTHGGFYAHFADRDELVVEAVMAAAMDTAEGAFAEGNSLEQALARYLSRGHLEHPELGCVLAALGTDGVRQEEPVRGAFARVARGFLAMVEHKLHPGRRAKEPTNAGLRTAATLVGAVMLGRLVDDPKLAERILSAARNTQDN